VSGFGSDPFGGGPFGAPSFVVAASPLNALSSSRGVNGVTRRYVVNDEGGFAAMDDTAQRVMLALAFGVTQPKTITPETRAALETQIRAALRPLTAGREPAIKILSLTVDDNGRDELTPRLAYKNLLTGTLQSTP
jgi:hypothetical protein